MQILLDDAIEQGFVAALKEAGNREIGGILMGECIADDTYRVKSFTAQRHGGSPVFFVRVIREALGPLRSFFRQTGYNFRRFNYLGEWHSHPRFAPEPSCLDSESMWEIVEDKGVGANFVVLLIIRLNDVGRLEGTAIVYMPGRHLFRGKLVCRKSRQYDQIP